MNKQEARDLVKSYDLEDILAESRKVIEFDIKGACNRGRTDCESYLPARQRDYLTQIVTSLEEDGFYVLYCIVSNKIFISWE